MIIFYYHPTPNPLKVALLLEELAVPYDLVAVDTARGEQHLPAFRAVNPNGKVPVVIDTDGSDGKEIRVFDSTAILLYLAEKFDRFLGAPAMRGDLLSWLMFIGTGVGPFSGQAVHFRRFAPVDLDYARNRYEAEMLRHYRIIDDRLKASPFLAGDSYTIADMSLWGWIERAGFVLGKEEKALDDFPGIRRWASEVEVRPAVARARKVGAAHPFKTEFDEETRRALFPTSYPLDAQVPA